MLLKEDRIDINAQTITGRSVLWIVCNCIYKDSSGINIIKMLLKVSIIDVNL
jgi:hypothetical protein